MPSPTFVRPVHSVVVTVGLMLAFIIVGLATPAVAQESTPDDCDRSTDAELDEGRCPVEVGEPVADEPSLQRSEASAIETEPAPLLDPALLEALAADSAEADVAPALDDASATSPSGGGLYGEFYKTLPRISAVGVIAAAAQSVADAPALGGHNPDNDGFTLQQIELALQSSVDPYFIAEAYLHFSEHGVEVDEVYAETLALPWSLQARIGKYFSSFGRFNTLHTEQWRFVDQPLVHNRFLGGEALGPLGVQLSWLAPTPFYLQVTGNVHNATTAGGEADAMTFGRDARYDLLYVGRVESYVPFSDAFSALIGFSVATAPSGQGAGNMSDLWGGDVYLRYKPVEGDGTFDIDWQTEALLRRRQLPGLLLADWGITSELGARVAQRWRVAARVDWLDGDAVRSEIQPTRGRRQRWLRSSAAVSFEPSEFSRLRLQYSFDNPKWHDEDVVHSAFVQVEFSIGPHGAHPF